MRYRYRDESEMKDSGIEWIGKIPKDWSVNKLKYLTYCEDGKRIPLSAEERGKIQGNIPYWGANSIIDYVNDYLINYEVILIGEDGAPFFDKLKNIAFYSNEKIWPNNHVHILKVNKNIDAKFLVNSLNIVDFRNYIKGSTRDKLSQSDMKEILVRIPLNKKEQNKISNFINVKTIQFDSIISKKEELIQKLEGAKKSLISEVVTGKVKVVKTNDGYELIKRNKEEMKDSGVEWIGKIPRNWNINKLKYLTYCEDGKRIPLSAEERGKIQGDIPYWGANRIIDYVNDYLIDYEVILIGEDGAPFFDKLKNVAFYSNEKIWPNNHVHILKANKKINAKFLVNSLNIVDFRNYIKGSTRDKLSQSDMKEILVRIPLNKREQNKIVDFIEEKISKFDSIISKKEELIQKLKEAKQSLISEAVTGKIEILD